MESGTTLASLSKTMMQLALPTTIYIILGTIAAVSNTAAMQCPEDEQTKERPESCPNARAINVIIDFIGVGLWALLVEIVYRHGWHKTSWALAFLPILIVVFILLVVVFMVGFTGYK